MAETLVSIYVFGIMLPLFYLVFPLSFAYSIYYLIVNLKHTKKIKHYLTRSVLVFSIVTLLAHFHHILADPVAYFEYIKWLYYSLISIYAILYMAIPFFPYLIYRFYANNILSTKEKAFEQLASSYFIFSIIFLVLLSSTLPQKIANGISWNDFLYLPNIVNISQVFDIFQL